MNVVVAQFGRATAIVAILMAPVGCSTQGDGRGFMETIGDTFSDEDESTLTPAERRLREDNQLFNETILGGFVIGATQGAILGALYGLIASRGDASGAATGAVIGAVAGGALGGFDGWRVAVRQEAARKEVREIEILADEVEEENNKIRQSVDNMDVVIADTQRSLRDARDGYRSQQVSLDELREREARAKQNIEQIDGLIEKMEERNKDYSDIADQYRGEGEDTTDVDLKIEKTRELVAQKKQERDLLAEELEVGRIG